MTDRLQPRRRSGRRKGESSVRVFGTEELLAMFECDDVEVLHAKLEAMGVRPHVSHAFGVKLLFVSSYQLPDEFSKANRRSAADVLATFDVKNNTQPIRSV